MQLLVVFAMIVVLTGVVEFRLSILSDRVKDLEEIDRMNAYQGSLIMAITEVLTRLSQLTMLAKDVEQANKLNEVYLAANAELQRILEVDDDVAQHEN